MINLILINFILTEVWDKLNFPNTIAGILTGWITKGRICSIDVPLARFVKASIDGRTNLLDRIFCWGRNGLPESPGEDAIGESVSESDGFDL